PMAPGGIEPPHAASKAAALSAELRGRGAKAYPGPRLATLCRLGGGSSVGRAPGCGPGGRGFESRPPPSLMRQRGRGCGPVRVPRSGWDSLPGEDPQHLAVEGRNVVRLPARHEVAVDDDLLVRPFATRI